MKQFFLLALLIQSMLVAQENTFSTTGTIYPEHTSSLSSRATGRITHVSVDVGDHVKKGDPLITIDPLFFTIDVEEAEASVALAKIALSEAQLNFERMSKLWNKAEASISKKRFEDAEVSYNLEKCHLKQAEDTLKRAKALLEESVIRAPYDGVITKRYVHPGESVVADSGQKLLEIESCGSIYIEFSIPQALLSKVHTGSTVLVGDTHVTSAITLIAPHIDEKTRSIKCRAKLNGPCRMFQTGALVTVQVGV